MQCEELSERVSCRRDCTKLKSVDPRDKNHGKGIPKRYTPHKHVVVKHERTWSSGITIRQRYPFALHSDAKQMPVLPEVPSTTVPPAFSWPVASARAIMLAATRSLEVPPGLRNSAYSVRWQRQYVSQRPGGAQVQQKPHITQWVIAGQDHPIVQACMTQAVVDCRSGFLSMAGVKLNRE